VQVPPHCAERCGRWMRNPGRAGPCRAGGCFCIFPQDCPHKEAEQLAQKYPQRRNNESPCTTPACSYLGMLAATSAYAMTGPQAKQLAKAAYKGNPADLTKLEAAANSGNANEQYWLGIYYAGHLRSRRHGTTTYRKS
jgi:hypothetical protein